MRVAIVMGSDSDWRIMEAAKTVLDDFGVPTEIEILSAHRTPERMLEWGGSAAESGVDVIIAGAGGSAHLPGMLAAVTPLPVIGVPVALSKLDGMDSLLSIVQMPTGVPVATVAIDGAANAALLAIRMLAISNPDLRRKLDHHRTELKSVVAEKNLDLKSRHG